MTVKLPESLPFSKEDEDVVDLVGVHPFKPIERRQPKNKTDLINAVSRSTIVKRELRALGSAWSLSPATEAEDVIDTLFLRQHLSPPYGGTAALHDGRLAAGAINVLAAFCKQHASEASGRKFVYVEAGIKINKLLEDLKSCGLALPTMGAGGGQSLAGALSTSTHGADFTVPPLVEWVRAVHLVGPLGKEWWITPANSIFTGVQVLQLPDWPAVGEILANDDAFNAVRVAVGRMGVIYSLILEVVEPYTLLEITHQGGALSNVVQRVNHQGEVFATGQVFTNPSPDKNSWPKVRAQLANSGVADGQPFGIFETPITDFYSGWLRQEVIEPTAAAVIEAFKAKVSAEHDTSAFAAVVPDPTARSLAEEFYASLTVQDRNLLDGASLFLSGLDLPSTFDSLGLTDFVLQRMGLEQVAASLPGRSVKPLRHLNIVVSLATPDVCWITRRWALPGVTATANLEPAPRDEATQILVDHRDDPMPILAFLSNKIISSIIRGIDDQRFSVWNIFDPVTVVAGVTLYGKYSVLDPVLDFINREVPRINQEVTAANGTSGQALFLFLYRAVTDPDPRVRDTLTGPILATVTEAIGRNAFVNPARVGESAEILDVHSYDLDYNVSGDSAEYLFDASGDNYLAFADDVVKLARPPQPSLLEPPPIFGYMGIRFTPRASALIAMQRYELTASVEVATASAKTDPVYANFWAAVHDSARKNGGIPHWGQEFIRSSEDVSAHYDGDLLRWRQILAELSEEDPHVFSTAFTRDLGLEPLGPGGFLLYDALRAFLTALEGAADS